MVFRSKNGIRRKVMVPLFILAVHNRRKIQFLAIDVIVFRNDCLAK
jgi:hypothetical protein